MFNIKTKTLDYMSVVITHVCDRNCPFCIDAYRGRNEFIKDNVVEKAILFAKDKNIKDILLVGGEPLLHPNIINIAKNFKNNNFNVVLTTNYTNKDILTN
jgi:molybdenum cofactor biosynthesis enzyme MoaA